MITDGFMYVALLLFMSGAYSGSLVPVGILMALFGYVIGTPLATLCANFMRSLV